MAKVYNLSLSPSPNFMSDVVTEQLFRDPLQDKAPESPPTEAALEEDTPGPSAPLSGAASFTEVNIPNGGCRLSVGHSALC